MRSTYFALIEMLNMQTDQTATTTREREEGGTKDEVARHLGNFPVSLLLLLLQHLFSLLSRSSPSILVDVFKIVSVEVVVAVEEMLVACCVFS